MTRGARILARVLAVATVGLLAGGVARALPVPGAARSDVELTDAWDRSIHLAAYVGKPVLVVYEDKGSSSQNEALKEELAAVARGDRYKTVVALVAVADVSGYDYWPIRGFVRSALRSESQKQGTVIYCDWDGHVRGTLGLERGQSNVVLYGRSGVVLYSHAGPMSVEERRTFFATLRGQVELP
jgi:predicted transcriptional regulator